MPTQPIKPGFDDSNAVLRLRAGTYFKIEGHDAIFRKLDTGEARFLDASAREPHICHPWTVTPAVLLKTDEGEDVFQLAFLPVRTTAHAVAFDPARASGPRSCAEPYGSDPERYCERPEGHAWEHRSGPVAWPPKKPPKEG